MDLASSSSWSTAPTSGRWTYDVFLSFRGEDTRNNFVDHLYSALDQAGIYTFKDDEKLHKGKSIAPELVKAIEESMVSVVVFSKNYANSSWCLEELVKIMECWDSMGQRVLPVFYDVDPSDVRGQKGSIQTALQHHEVKLINDYEKVKRWREALKTAANLSGWDVTASGLVLLLYYFNYFKVVNDLQTEMLFESLFCKSTYRREAECIKQIVRTILNYVESLPDENLIGMESRIHHVKSLLCKRVDDVCFIGIWGMGGIGKTTIARAVYRQISYAFEGSSFLEDVRESGSDKRGLKSLQEKLLSEILTQKQFEVKDCEDGMCQIWRRLRCKKVLVVLDDVDNIKQLEFLAGARDWFGPGSRIIVTTIDEHLLCYAQEKYAPELLKGIEAMKLFSRYAFMENIPPKEFEELSHVVVSHTGHLPLALKVLGSHFCSRNLDFWQSAINILTKIPQKEVNKILKLSYDGLNVLEKKIFLHIACFFKGKKRRHVTRILDAMGFEAVSGITVLIEKSLLSISDGDLHMHDLIQEMGQCIVRERYPNTMVWAPEETEEVTTTINFVEVVEAMVQPAEVFRINGFCSAEILKDMKKLRLLEVQDRFTFTEPTHFPQQLRWLSWNRYPFDSLRITRDITNLVGLQMIYGLMRQLHIEEKVILPHLKFINLQGSYWITMFPDVSWVPNLKWLNLSHCSCLVDVHESVFLHEKIIYLNLSYCERLEILPSFIKMKSLQTLLLNNCHRLKTFPEVSTDMETLSVLHIDCCYSIRALPSSIRLLTGLTILTMGSSFGFTYEVEVEQGNRKRIIPNLLIQGSLLSSLRALELSDNLLEDNFPSNLHTAWPSLEEFLICSNKFTRLPATISQLSHLKYLDLTYCYCLQELPVLPSLIQVLKAKDCTSLQKIGDLSNTYKWLFKISVGGCPKLLKDGESQSHIANMLMKSLVQKCAAVNHRLSITVPGSKIPNWFNNQRLGYQIELYLPQSQISKMIGLAICCCVEALRFHTIRFQPSDVEGLTSSPTYPGTSAERIWIGYMSMDIIGKLCQGLNSENLIISFYDGVLACGVCVLYKDDIEPMAGIGPWVSDYDDMHMIVDYSKTVEELQHERWSLPSFTLNRKDNSVTVNA